MDGIASRQSREIQKDGGRQREADAEMETASDRLTGKVPNINHLDKSNHQKIALVPEIAAEVKERLDGLRELLWMDGELDGGVDVAGCSVRKFSCSQSSGFITCEMRNC